MATFSWYWYVGFLVEFEGKDGKLIWLSSLLWKNCFAVIMLRSNQNILLCQQGVFIYLFIWVLEWKEFCDGQFNRGRKQGCRNRCRGVSCHLLRSGTNYGSSWCSLILLLYNCQSKRETFQKVCKNTSQHRTDPNNSDQLRGGTNILGLLLLPKKWGLKNPRWGYWQSFFFEIII